VRTGKFHSVQQNEVLFVHILLQKGERKRIKNFGGKLSCVTSTAQGGGGRIWCTGRAEKMKAKRYNAGAVRFMGGARQKKKGDGGNEKGLPTGRGDLILSNWIWGLWVGNAEFWTGVI